MKAIRFHEKGAPDVLQLEDVPQPVPGSGDLLVKIEAAGISYGDVLRRRGGHYPIPTPLPCLPGEAVAGTVTDVGAGTSPEWIGKRVYGRVHSGGYAEYATGYAAGFLTLPDGVSAADAVAVLSDGVSAALILKWVGKIKPGETVLVPAAAGGFGFVTVQLARLYGARRVIGLASTPEKRAEVLTNGADVALDYTREGWSADAIAANGGVGVDLALEMTGGETFYQTVEATRDGGRIVNYGNASDTNAPINPRQLLRRNLTLIGFMSTNAWHDEKKVAGAEVLSFLAKGRLRAQATCWPLEQAAEAHRNIESRASTGRQILLTGA